MFKRLSDIHSFIHSFQRQRGPLGEPSLGLGPELSGFERIVLVMLRHVSMSSWQPVLGLLPA